MNENDETQPLIAPDADGKGQLATLLCTVTWTSPMDAVPPDNSACGLMEGGLGI